MKKLIQLIVFFSLILVGSFTHSLQAQVNKVTLPFTENTSEVKARWHSYRLIDTYEEAVKIGFNKKSKEAERFYQNNAVFLFDVGGGCYGPKSSEITITLENDTIKIVWDEPPNCPLVGKHASFAGQFILSKKTYPNYKQFKVIVVN